MKTLNDYFPMIASGEITAEAATVDALANGMADAIELFSPQSEADLPYWKMLKTDAWSAYEAVEAEKKADSDAAWEARIAAHTLNPETKSTFGYEG